MPDSDVGDRTEEATPRKLEDARKKGQVSRSHDLSAALILLGALCALKLWGHYLLDAMYGFLRGALGNMDVAEIGEREVCIYFGQGGLMLMWATLPILGALAAVAFACNVMQTGFVFSGEPLNFKFSRINPLEGVKNLVSKRGLVRLMSSLFKVTVIGLVAYFTIRGQFRQLTQLITASMGDIFSFAMNATWVLALKISIALLALALLDFLYQRWQFMQDMKMTKQEVREELKRMEGDQLTRNRRRRMQRQLAMQRMMQAVPKADVVVTNPTHISVALRYDSKTMDSPKVVAKGKGFVAQRIREIAEEHGVPLVERKPLAQALYKMCEVGDPVPVKLYQAVAEVLAFVYELNRMHARARMGVA